MGRTAIVTGGTSKDVSAMGTLAINIQEVIPDLVDELIIFHDGIHKKEQQIIQNIFPTRFYKYKFPIDFVSMRKNRSLRYFSPMIFCKYECFRLLEIYDRIIWTDYDVVILKDLYELMDNVNSFQIVEDNAPLKRMFLPSAEEAELTDYNLEKRGICTPIFVVTKEIGNYMELYQWCINSTLKYAPYIDLPEQCIISMMVQAFKIPYFNLSGRQYALHPSDYDGKASIIHAYGRPKFWEGLYNEQWMQYYERWIAVGGSEYKQPLKEKIIQLKENILAMGNRQKQ